MRALLRTLVLLLCLGAAGGAVSQDEPPEGRVDLRRLSESTTRVSGMGTEVPGVDLASMADMRHWIGDDSSYASRLLVDTTWLGPRKGLDSIVPGVGVHWVRYHLEPQPDVRHRPLWLVVQSAVPFVLYHNGVEVLRSVGLPESPGERVLPHGRTLVPVTLPWRPAHFPAREGDGRDCARRSGRHSRNPALRRACRPSSGRG